MIDHDDRTVQALALISGLVEQGKAAGVALRERCELEASILRDFADITEQTVPAPSGNLDVDGARQIILGTAELARMMAARLDEGLVPMKAMQATAKVNAGRAATSPD